MMTKQCGQSDADNDVDNGDGWADNDNCNGDIDGKSNDAATTTYGAMTTMAAIQRWQLDNSNRTTAMVQRQCNGNGRPATCRTLASAVSPIQGNNQLMWPVWGGGDKREGQFGGIEPQKRVKVELIEWRSIDLHSISSKSTFCPPQSSKCTGAYSACILGVRLCYWRHGEHGFKVWLEDECIQYQSVLQIAHFIFCYVLIKVYLSKSYTSVKLHWHIIQHWPNKLVLFLIPRQRRLPALHPSP